MRLAEYVAPLGSTSLIFNFMFAKFLIHTPVTANDIYVRIHLCMPRAHIFNPHVFRYRKQGTVIVIVGVIGIVAFGSINSGLGTETDAAHLTHLWTRANWLLYFFCMAFALIFVYIFVSQLDIVLAVRSDITSTPSAAYAGSLGLGRGLNVGAKGVTFGARLMMRWEKLMMAVRERLEVWTASHDDKRVAWTLGIGWACCGGGLAGGTLVFAKAAYVYSAPLQSHDELVR